MSAIVRSVCLDFDGVLHWYRKGFKGQAVVDDAPVPGAVTFVKELLARGYTVYVHSSRFLSPAGIDAVVEWLKRHGFPMDRNGIWISVEKPPALLYVDDRGFRFDGDFAAVLSALDDAEGVRPWIFRTKKPDAVGGTAVPHAFMPLVDLDKVTVGESAPERMEPSRKRSETGRSLDDYLVWDAAGGGVPRPLQAPWPPAPSKESGKDDPPGMRVRVVTPTPADFLRMPDVAARRIAQVARDLGAFLAEKNAAYGNSVFDPARVLSSASPEEAIRVRIDDKLSRLMRGDPAARERISEDTVLDLAGYLVLLLVARGWALPSATGDGSPAKAAT